MNSEIYEDGDEYDRLVGALATGEGSQFYQQRAREASGPVLELGCGTGRITIPIAESGVEIVGLDLSDTMLGVARKKAANRNVSGVSFVPGDARSFDLGAGRFGLIFFPANSFQHLLDWRDAVACLQCVESHLSAEGTFACDIWNPSLEMLTRDPAQRYPVAVYTDADGATVILTETNRYDRATQINHITWYYQRETETSTTETSRALQMRQFFPQEIEALANSAGVTITEKYGGWNGEEFTNDSARQVLVFRPKKDGNHT